MSRAIDVHAHVLPPLLIEVADRGETRWGIDFRSGEGGRMEFRAGGSWLPLLQRTDVYGESPAERAARMRKIRIDIQVLSLSPSLFLYLEDRDHASAFCADVNDAMAAFVDEQPSSFRGFAMLPLSHPGAAVSELERLKTLPGIVGAVAGTHVNGRDWDQDELSPVLEAAAGLEVPIFIHPASVRASGILGRHHLRNLVGNPLETTLAMAAFVFGGVLDRFPSLRLCFAHGGGYGVFAMGRFDHGHRVRDEAHSGHIPSEYLSRMWFDCLTHDETALRFLIDKAGAGRVVLGSDDPADMGLANPMDWIEACSTLSNEERSQILGASPVGLLGDALR